MAELSIVTMPDTRLRLPSLPVTEFDTLFDLDAFKPGQPIVLPKAPLSDFTNTMLSLLPQVHGVGMSAVQVGDMRQIFVVDLTPWEQPDFKKVFINAQILHTWGEPYMFRESCLSLPETLNQYDNEGKIIREGDKLEIWRRSGLRLRYQDIYGQVFEEDFEDTEEKGKVARVLFHECDHQGGILITDRVESKHKSLPIAC